MPERHPAIEHRARRQASAREGFQQAGRGEYLGFDVGNGRGEPADPAFLQEGLLTPFTADPVTDGAFVVRAVEFTNRKLLRYFLDEILHQPSEHDIPPQFMLLPVSDGLDSPAVQ
jgi:hypothetical protein